MRCGFAPRAAVDADGAQAIAINPYSVIGDTAVDAIVIAAPDQCRAPSTLACIATGKSVLYEKPLIKDRSESLAMMLAERREERDRCGWAICGGVILSMHGSKPCSNAAISVKFVRSFASTDM